MQAKTTVARFLQFGVFLLLLGGCASQPKPPALTAEQKQANVESFDIVYSKIKERHFDPAKVGPAWDAEHARLRPKVETATTMGEARSASKELIDSLHQSHFGIIPGDVYSDLSPDDSARPESGSGDWSGDPGFQVRAIDGKAVVTRVRPGSPAAKAGVIPGWTLLKVDSRDVTKVLAKMDASFAGKQDKGMLESAALRSIVGGGESKPMEAVFLDGNDKQVAVTLDRIGPAGTPVTFGNLPTLYLEIEDKKLPEMIGYFYFSIWFDPPKLMPALQKALESCDDCRGFILDLRGNIGGIGALAMGFGGWFVDKPNQRLGTMTTRDSSFNFVLNPRSKPFMGPLAILVDEMSASTSEIFAGGMQDIGRARVFGTHTPGAALPSTVEKLPNGDRLQYAFANYVSAKGTTLEATGVVPDEPIALSRELLLAEGDPVLNAAIRWIQSQSGARAGK
ncbi:MAG: S41 family peptidase [Phycisphaerales bacterium]|nr:hypothetical protein [Planctomycetota bacterium]